ncbi:C40 family peptidase [Streptomyces sp. NBC_01264]|uniref:C40 family peptidase n=1 Tax=Streptomyces sp. NBC_01264 TaxID=2903804 RepID=UPI00225B3BD5|nr:C40 family peptidase [Streptomyces sp. NBC_01264]MCX4781791.1 C40 family peptidase [Streptomyces sp. NBC_01264]
MSDSSTWQPHSPSPQRATSGRHRKPAGPGPLTALRVGVTTGVLGTVAAITPVAADAVTNPAAGERESVTMELDLTSFLDSITAETADAVRQTGEAHAREAAAKQAAAEAKAEAKAAAEKAAAEEAARQKAAQEKAAREKAAREKAAREKAAKARAAKAAAAQAARTSAVTPGSGTTTSGTGAAAVIEFARGQLGTAYIMGGTSATGWDCSGLVQAAYRQAGIELPRVSQSQSAVGSSVPLGDLRAGDILYWGSPGSAHHVALYIGDGKFIGAQNPSVGVVERDLAYDAPSGAVRLL